MLSNFAYCDRCYRSLVCLSDVRFVHCAQTAEDIDTISFAYDHPVDLSERRHSISMANCGRMVRDSAMVTMDESLYETTIAWSNCTIAEPLQPPFPRNGGPKCTQRAIVAFREITLPLLSFSLQLCCMRYCFSHFCDKQTLNING